MAQPPNKTQRVAFVVLITLGLLSAGALLWIGLFGGTYQFAEHTSLAIETESRNWQLLAFIVAASISLWLIIPSGSLLLIGAGFAIGTGPATLIYYCLHCLFCWPAYQLAKQGLRFAAADDAATALERNLPNAWKPTLIGLQNQPFLASVALRLIPVIPNAAACIAAPMLGISFRTFFLATALTCWIRPLFYASVGGSLSELSELRDPASLAQDINALPLIGLGISALALLIARSFIAGKRLSTPHSEL